MGINVCFVRWKGANFQMKLQQKETNFWDKGAIWS